MPGQTDCGTIKFCFSVTTCRCSSSFLFFFQVSFTQPSNVTYKIYICILLYLLRFLLLSLNDELKLFFFQTLLKAFYTMCLYVHVFALLLITFFWQSRKEREKCWGVCVISRVLKKFILFSLFLPKVCYCSSYSCMHNIMWHEISFVLIVSCIMHKC